VDAKTTSLSPQIDASARLKSMREEILRLQNLFCSEDVTGVELQYERQKLLVDLLEKTALYLCLSEDDGGVEYKKSKIYLKNISLDECRKYVSGFEKLFGVDEELPMEFSLAEEKNKLINYRAMYNGRQQKIKKLESSVSVGKILLAFDKLELTHLPQL